MNINATILGQTIAFFFFVVFCMKYIWPPIINTIETRQKEIIKNLDSIERAKKDLDLMQINSTNQLKQAKNEAQIIIEQAHKRRIQILDQAKNEAEIERNRILAQAQAKINIEYLHAHEKLRTRMSSLILAGAEKIIERSIDKDTNDDIINNLISKL
ncbi:F0F1 ATP synthase subunit B [Pantoea sp. Mhis]|uniref:F0F1 ATP synthase subunit B n=1 Tax=Pantoea sp. Mhis TaxID=2576759 RepID=UPI001359308D|nr:F0F1 ATP synthase subunit B [Pantoea sp. Mhis]MXP56753.1 F0F1 ATP synthase subunit B [Pantoea sp. Mhis]